jgi:XrtN system VIT domain protein
MEQLKPVEISTQYVDNQPIETPTPKPFNPLQNGKMIFGFAAILLATILFMLSQATSLSIFSGAGFLNGTFWLTHLAFVVLFALSIFSKKSETLTFPTRLNLMFAAVVLMQIGSFTLNIEMNVFPVSTDWLQVVLTVSALALIGLTFRDLIPEKMVKITLFLIGIGFIIDMYFMVITLPMLPICGVGFIFFGISIYAFAPILKIFLISRFLFKNHAFMPKTTRFFGFGAAFSLVLSAAFFGFWTSMAFKADAAFQKNDSPFPAWVRVAQVLPPSVLTEKMLKSNQSRRFQGGGNLLAFNTNNDRFHDPLVVIANLIKPLPDLEETDRANALRAIFDAKNAAERRLWTGDNLRLANIETAIDIHAPQRIAYTEQVLSIENTKDSKSFWRTEEAILTFRLPEGGVVSTLSLWVNGVEREGLLTTQEKAANAYATIVGVENRDPSVIHWQEGNAVSVRIFPCTPTEMRKVKIGFTTPLEVSDGKLLYHLPTLEGVPATKATHKISLAGVENFESKIKFEKSNAKYAVSTTYDPDLSLTTALTPLSESFFSFQNKTYKMHEMGAPETLYAPFEPTEIYLDINAAWSDEAENIWQLVKNKPVYAFADGKMTALTEQNRTAIFKQLETQNFSIFPFHHIQNPANALVISMNDRPFAPDFTALKGSKFADDMAEKLPNMPKIRTFTLGSTNYLNALEQMRVTLNDKGNVKKLAKILKEKTFLKDLESDEELAIAPSKLLISEERTNDKVGGTAPDHVLRLFAYNKVLATVGRNFYRKTEDIETHYFDMNDALRLAQKAHIVTPISSLIVLETQADYDRFNIRKSKNALGNASITNAGAAPEPHEWLLIILAAGIILWTIRQRNQA